ncbi:MAG: hypothetical protein OXC28_24705 [Defluviicoccus sp.]|nr:hypothetical protein [Defluviicoccus sp.]
MPSLEETVRPSIAISNAPAAPGAISTFSAPSAFSLSLARRARGS